ncbi:hypothetical protein MNBD_DELTA02-385 [hydrothermal vent metagenome]|uniref:Uncharacterized protein n=1 Tax=hydrothermal vent metagenome TaxID=652676 RepID=A0A3B0V4X7_9ZZZZ
MASSIKGPAILRLLEIYKTPGGVSAKTVTPLKAVTPFEAVISLPRVIPPPTAR